MHIVIVTGGSRGIGASIARHCARRGMGVVLTYKDSPEAAAGVVAGIEGEGGLAAALRLDVADSASFAAFRQALHALLGARFGRSSFDYLVNNAGHGLFNPIATVSEEEFDGLFRVHLKGPFFLTQALLPLLADGGHIVNLTSATTRCATVGVAPYAAFKGALAVLTRYMAREFGVRGIRANSVSPGAIRTGLAGGLSEDFAAVLADKTALGRVGEADDVGAAVASLLSDDNRWINAQDIELSGGYLI